MQPPHGYPQRGMPMQFHGNPGMQRAPAPGMQRPQPPPVPPPTQQHGRVNLSPVQKFIFRIWERKFSSYKSSQISTLRVFNKSKNKK